MYPIEIQNIGNKDLKIVTIGGGTGNSTILRGLKKFTTNITTIVTVADDGGGSGVLREELGILPPGDIRACLIALANTEPAMEKLMQYRFNEGKLKGQSFGNLFLAAMNDIYGDFDKAVKEAGEVLAITGKVLPMTLEDVVLYAELEGGITLKGESNITEKNKDFKKKINRVYIEPKLSDPLDEAIDDIMDADLIIIGPGSLYTSIIPNLLVKNIAEALNRTNAKIYYVCNIMTQDGETDNMGVKEHVEAINRHLGYDIIDKIVVNNDIIPNEVLQKYEAKPIYYTKADEEKLDNYEVLLCPCYYLLDKYIRHDAERISKYIIDDFNKDIVKIYDM
ncbi:gluconeogenesis factor YvcK family protein [Miniphocaeibacter massiliensis]|uniref:gluconeogenesis factor YvcK family protein n=1 Tax=Miniphocaeibacter massiliensis TaxID=2041841 RepID=UPI000C06E0CA|nr:gluconeogenesis factor YvcK family protein [Miniphocaeibacter massiliensis]